MYKYSLIVFITSSRHETEVFIKAQTQNTDLVECRVMSNFSNHTFCFAALSYTNEEALKTAMKQFASKSLFVMRIRLRNPMEKTSDETDDELLKQMQYISTTELPGLSPLHVLERVSLYDSDNKINLKLICRNIFLEYCLTNNLEATANSLANHSMLKDNFEIFVMTLLVTDLNGGSKVLFKLGTLFSELIINKTLSIKTVNKGINTILINWKTHIVNSPNLFCDIASAISALILKTGFYDFHHLKDVIGYVSSNICTILIMEIFKNILDYSKEIETIKEPGGIIWLYYKWTMSDYIPLNIFIPCHKMSNYYKRDRLGVFLLSIFIYDYMKLIKPSKLTYWMVNWIETAFDEEIVIDPIFVRVITISCIFLLLKLVVPFQHFSKHKCTRKLIEYYIKLKSCGPDEIQAREIQCLYGMQIASAVVSYPRGMVIELLTQLQRSKVVSSKSIEIWRNESKFNVDFLEDQMTKKAALETFDWEDLHSGFINET